MPLGVPIVAKAKPSDDVYRAIGRISVEFNWLEFLVRVYPRPP